ncbi:MAG: thioredoxin domain-containing protein [Acidobacteriota bacterium]
MRENLGKFVYLVVLSSLAYVAPSQAATSITDDMLRSLNVCTAPVKITRGTISSRLPKGVKAEIITMESSSAWCGAVVAALTFPDGSYFVGQPWFVADIMGSREDKLKQFAWQRLQESLTATVDTAKASNGLSRVRLSRKTDYGDMIETGWMDQEGLVYIPGELHKAGEDLIKARQTEIARVMGTAPTKGPAPAKVTVVEFSDFECPSCKLAVSYMKPLMAKYSDRVKFVRIDLPLISHHPWAFPAALAGRAIYRQNPDLFWKYKDWVYANQEDLSAFSIADFAKNFVADNGLDVKKFESDVQSANLRKEIFEGINAATAIDIHGTPTFFVNGVSVDPGRGGEGMEKYITAKLAGK